MALNTIRIIKISFLILFMVFIIRFLTGGQYDQISGNVDHIWYMNKTEGKSLFNPKTGKTYQNKQYVCVSEAHLPSKFYVLAGLSVAGIMVFAFVLERYAFTKQK